MSVARIITCYKIRIILSNINALFIMQHYSDITRVYKEEYMKC